MIVAELVELLKRAPQELPVRFLNIYHELEEIEELTVLVNQGETTDFVELA